MGTTGNKGNNLLVSKLKIAPQTASWGLQTICSWTKKDIKKRKKDYFMEEDIDIALVGQEHELSIERYAKNIVSRGDDVFRAKVEEARAYGKDPALGLSVVIALFQEKFLAMDISYLNPNMGAKLTVADVKNIKKKARALVTTNVSPAMTPYQINKIVHSMSGYYFLSKIESMLMRKYPHLEPAREVKRGECVEQG